MLSSQQILDVVGAEPSAALAGKVAYMRRSLKTGMHGKSGPDSHHQFLADVADQSAAAGPPGATYQHPADDPRVRAVKPSEAGLSGSDLAWLNRLPTDPAKVSHDDAIQLAGLAAGRAGLAAGLPGSQAASDARLIQSVWEPVREIHDANAARAALTAAQTSPPPVPSSAVRALADAVAAETPALTPTEALSRAGSQLRDTLDNRVGARQQRVLDARAAIARASEAAAVRTATTR